MISNYLLGHYKLVLFVDHIGIERSSKKILETILQEESTNIIYELDDECCKILENKKILILNQPISKLELEHSLQEIFAMIQKFKTNEHIKQIFAWASSINIQSKILIPFLEHMSELIVTIKSKDVLSILSKSKFGTVKLKEYRHDLCNGKIQIKELKAEDQLHLKLQEDTEVDIETIGTFKIGQFTPEELEAKRNLTLPFEKIGSNSSQERKEAKIIYTPENVDDFDEEDDPDNDLQF